MPDTPAPTPPRRLVALPQFAAPPSARINPPGPDQRLTPSSDPRPPAGPSTPGPDANPSGPGEPLQEPSTEPVGSPPTSTSTDRRRPRGGGDPTTVAKVIGGLLVIATSALDRLLSRSDRGLRQPTPAQRDAIAEPTARLLCRHLPLAALNESLLDFTEAATATHDYLLDGRLLQGAAVTTNVPEIEEGP